MQIAIDGPAGSGKSTIAKIVADRHGFIYLDTGAMYRSAVYLKLNHALDYPELYKVLEGASFDFFNNGKGLVLNYTVKGKAYSVDVTGVIRTPEVTSLVSEVSADKDVRLILTAKQKKIAEEANVVMDGRDIGTVVLPNADAKFFLTASPAVRAKRRVEEWKSKGTDLSYEQVLADVMERDRYDSERVTAPLKKAEDSKEIDTSDLTIDEVAAIICAVVEKLQRG